MNALCCFHAGRHSNSYFLLLLYIFFKVELCRGRGEMASSYNITYLYTHMYMIWLLHNIIYSADQLPCPHRVPPSTGCSGVQAQTPPLSVSHCEWVTRLQSSNLEHLSPNRRADDNKQTKQKQYINIVVYK